MAAFTLARALDNANAGQQIAAPVCAKAWPTQLSL